MVFMNTHKQIHTFNKIKQAICAVPSLGRVIYDFEMHFFCFLITESSYASHPGNTILSTAES